MNIYYVYFYLRSDFTPYYVGKGKNSRAWTKGKYEVGKPKDTSKIVLIEQNLTELQAFILERYYIRWFGRKDLGTGILRNKTDGGDGCSGQIASEETRRKISEKKTGVKRPPVSEETRIKQSLTRKGKSFTEKHKQNIAKSQIGNKKSKETKEKISKIHKGKIISIETRNKMSIASKNILRTPHSKGTKEKISNTLKEKNISPPNKGIIEEKTVCPHCGKIGGNNIMKRWHFEKCKQYIKN